MWRWLTAGSLILTLFLAFVVIDRSSSVLGVDSHAYWVVDPSSPYERHAPELDAFLYSPPAVLVASAFSLLPWELFREAWRFGQVLVLVAVAGPLAGPLAITKPLTDELQAGNVNILMAAVVAFGFRWPALWAFAILTKVTPGIGLLWFAARGEWRSIGLAIGTAAAIAVPTIILFPNLWVEWINLLATQPADPPAVPILLSFRVRLLVACLLVIVGARFGRTWVMPFAVVLAHGHIWTGTMAVLLALVPLLRAGNLPPVGGLPIPAWPRRRKDRGTAVPV